ncbi:MAG: glycosyltransferase [Methylococcaceae bacterium]|nr:glycosyltransferase [Methylococcaceae bacterium]
MPTLETSKSFDTLPIHCFLEKEKHNFLPKVWQCFFDQQTVLLNQTDTKSCFYLSFSNLSKKTPASANTLLEEMTWVLLSNPKCNIVIWPLSSIDNTQPLSLLTLKTKTWGVIKEQGYICLSRFKEYDLVKQGIHTALCFSHALIATDKNVEQALSLVRRLKNKLTLEQKLFLMRKIYAVRELFSFSYQDKNEYLAHKKTWEPFFIRPELVLNSKIVPAKNRIPVLIATHWLELGGAEKFAIDLIKALPKERYAVYVTTDVASFNSWSSEITDEVEAIFHLPGFLTQEMMEVFYDYLIRSRKIRLMHIHHAIQAYESLFHIRRFHPELKILDSLHIIELPPNEGGYVDSSSHFFESFINHHHVISHYLRNFLVQRWRVDEDKVSVIYLNVDSEYFNPELVKKGQIRHILKIADNACVVGFIGRFSQQKQPLEFIKAAQLLQQRWVEEGQTNPLVFLMTGSGLLESEIKQAIKKTTGTTILLHPQVQDTRLVYQDCDILMMPSENEGLALVSYEAMSMQTPIFFTDVAAQNELMESEFLVENTQPLAEKFAKAVWPYLIDSKKRQQAGEKMRAYIQGHHDHKQTNAELLALYDALLTK